ncbi:MAG: BON domain-containing protein [Burkholderiaceae bacterium]|nr:MAG: BON domain-containing protein [Burkholderiaceae bacterium]MBE7425029.1 BON domain-containing protein [Ideonella sp.]MCC7286357.1 BON domain-containing protein [Burkholderiaceae bacterium]
MIQAPNPSLPRRGRPQLLIAAVLAALQLGACAPLVIGGAMVGGTLMYVDRRSTGAQVEDQAIELKASRRVGELLGDRGHVNATSYNRTVLLTGEVPTEADRTAVEQAVQQIDNVRSTVNELAVGFPSSISSRSNDSFLTTKVKATFVDAKDLQANAIKVVTERGNVYLMGRVTEREANRASDLARSVSGVQKVVRVFEIISEAELADLTPKPAPAASGEPAKK